jgi:hypothetical protein
MPAITVTNPDNSRKKVDFERVYKIKRGQEQQAIAAAKQNGADDVIFRMNNGDLFIASRRGVPGQVNELDAVEYGQNVDYAGSHGEVLSLDNERNTIGETVGAAKWWGLTGLVGGLGAGIAGLLKFTQGSFGRTHWAVALGGGLALGAGAFLTSLLKGRQEPDYEKLYQYAERTDK